MPNSTSNTNTKNILQWFFIIFIIWLIPSTLLWSGVYLFIAEDCDRKDNNELKKIENKLENLSYDSSRERFFQKKFSVFFSDIKGLSCNSTQKLDLLLKGLTNRYPNGLFDIYLFNGDFKIVNKKNRNNKYFEKLFLLANQENEDEISQKDIDEIGNVIPDPSLVIKRIKSQKNRAVEIGNPDKYSLCYFNFVKNISPQNIAGIIIFVHYNKLTNKMVLTETIPNDLKSNYGFVDSKESILPKILSESEINDDYLQSYYKQYPTNSFRRYSKLICLKRLGEHCFLVGASNITQPKWTLYIVTFIFFIFASYFFFKFTYFTFVLKSEKEINIRTRIIWLFLICYIMPIIVGSILASQYLMELKSSLLSLEEQNNYKRLSEIDTGFERYITSKLIEFRKLNEELEKDAENPKKLLDKFKKINNEELADNVHIISSDSRILLSSALVSLEIRRHQKKSDSEKKEIFETWMDRNVLLTPMHNDYFEGNRNAIPFPNEKQRPGQHDAFLKVFTNTALSAMEYYNQSKNISTRLIKRTSNLIIGAVLETQSFGLFQSAKTNISRFTHLEAIKEKVLAYLDVIPGPNGEAWYCYTLLNNLENFERLYLEEIFNDIKHNNSRFNKILENEDIRAISDYYFATCFPTIKEYKTFEQSIRLSENNSKTFTHKIELNGENCYVSVLRGSYLSHYLLLKIFKDKDIEKIYKKQINVVVVIFIIVMVIGLALARLMTKFLIMPITDVINGVKALANKNYDYQIKIRSENEFGVISKAFNQTAISLKNMNITQKISNYFNIDKEIRCSSYTLNTAQNSSNLVNGDYVDCIQLKQGVYAIISANISKNDVKSVHLLSMLKTAFLTLIPMYPNTPDVMMAKLDKIFESHIKEGYIINCFIGILDPTNDIIVCANAGQPYPIIFDTKKLESEFVNLPSTSLGLSLNISSPYKKHEISLKNKTLILYSHGALDTINKENEDSSNDNFIKIVNEILNANNTNLADSILNKISSYSLNSPWKEDITILTLQNRL